MGDHFVLLVDRLLTESTLEAALESRNRSMEASSSAVKDREVTVSLMKMDLEDKRCRGKLVQCRICHDEDEVSNMETPCSCRGSLKYAHRRCIQRWCNEKGDIICEICLQQYKPGYTAPPQLFRFGHIRMNFRRNWEISRRDLHGTTQTARVVLPDHPFTNSSYEQYLTSVFCSIAIFLMGLLILKHTIPLVEMIENMEYSSSIFVVLLLRMVGIALPIYAIMRTMTFMQRHRQQRQRESPNASAYLSGNQNEQLASQRQSQVVRI